jgi:hypothetical protein
MAKTCEYVVGYTGYNLATGYNTPIPVLCGKDAQYLPRFLENLCDLHYALVTATGARQLAQDD